jgi:hypothetical protein
MKIIPAIAATLLFTVSCIQLATPSGAAEAAAAMPTKEDGAIDCTKEVWPNFSPSCLKNANRSIEVRLVTANRR